MRRKRTNSPSIQLAHQLELHRESGGRAVGVHNLADVLPPDKASGSGGGQRKVQYCQPASFQSSYCRERSFTHCCVIC